MNTIYKPYINFVYNIAEILPKLESKSNQSTCHAKQYRLLPAYNGLFLQKKKCSMAINHFFGKISDRMGQDLALW